MHISRLAKASLLIVGGFTLFGTGCFSTTTTQGLAQTGVQTIIQTLISLAVQAVVINASSTSTST